jgi:fermentation-respiration switch protein FrsA (DUF1100 family)
MRALLPLIAGLVLLYLALGVMLYLFQGSMVFLAKLPGRALDASPEDIGLDYEDAYIDTSDGERLHGWYVRAAEPRGMLLFFHGNAGNISHRLESIAIFNRLGLDVLIIDYRGYGQSTGHPSEQGSYRDARAAWDYLMEVRHKKPAEVVVFGRSLGGAVGAWLAAGLQAHEQPAAVIIESTFSSGADMARRLYPVYPARLLTRLKYPVIEFAARLQCPVLVVHSRDDEIIPFSMGEAIYAAAPQPKEFIELRGDHNAGFWISREAYAAGLAAFLSRVLPG